MTKNKDDAKIIALYVRVSTGYQVDKDSLPYQKKELKAYCEHVLHNKNYEIFEDAGKSGKNTDRPGFQRMMKKIYDGKVSHLIVYKIDRVSRNLVDFSIMYQELKKFHVTFISLNEQFDTSSAMGEAMLKIVLVFAELERNMTAERVMDVMVGRALEGKWNGARVPFGWRWNKEKEWPEHDPVEKPLAQQIYQVYADTRSTAKVRDFCFDNNVKTKRGGRWNTATIASYLRNPMNKGDYRYNYRHSGRGDKKPESEVVYIKDVFPPLVDPELWDYVNAVMDKNNELKNQTGRRHYGTVPHVFAGILRCSWCGSKMQIVTKDKARKNGFRPSTYVCTERRVYRNCDAPYASDVIVGPFVFNYIANLIRVTKKKNRISSLEDLQTELLRGKEFKSVKCIHQDDLSLIYDAVNASKKVKDHYIPEPVRKETPNAADIEKLEKEAEKFKRALERLRNAYLFDEEAMPESEYLSIRSELTEKLTMINNKKEDLKKDQFESREELSFINPASSFFLSYSIQSGEHIDYPEFAATVDVLTIKDFVQKTIEYVSVDNRYPVEIMFKNGLRTRFIRNEERSFS